MEIHAAAHSHWGKSLNSWQAAMWQRALRQVPAYSVEKLRLVTMSRRPRNFRKLGFTAGIGGIEGRQPSFAFHAGTIWAPDVRFVSHLAILRKFCAVAASRNSSGRIDAVSMRLDVRCGSHRIWRRNASPSAQPPRPRSLISHDLSSLAGAVGSTRE